MRERERESKIEDLNILNEEIKEINDPFVESIEDIAE